MRKQFSPTVLIIQSGFCALYATVITICCVLLLVQMKQSIISTRKAHLCVHLWDVDNDIFNRYVKRYKKPKHFFDFRMPPKTKQTKKVRNLEVNRTPSAASKGKYSKRSPQSSHRGEKVAEYHHGGDDACQRSLGGQCSTSNGPPRKKIIRGRYLSSLESSWVPCLNV